MFGCLDSSGHRGRSVLLALAALIAAGLVLVACGGGGGSTTAVSVEVSPLTKAKYTKRAQEGCEKRTQAIATVVNNALRPGAEVSMRTVESKAFPVIEAIAREIQSLGAPEGEQAKIEAFLTALDQDLEAAKRDPSNSMEELASRFKHSGDLATQNGLELCAFG